MLDAFILAGLLQGVNPELLSALCFVESGHKPAAISEHDHGSASYGLCQIKLATAKWIGFQGRPKDLLNPYTNAFYAAKYLRHQFIRFGSWKRAVSAYNAGSPVKSNKRYVDKVLGRAYGKYATMRLRAECSLEEIQYVQLSLLCQM